MKTINHILHLRGALCAATAMLAFAACAQAEVRPAPWIGNGMVLQRGTQATLCGTADAGEQVKVVFKKKTYTAVADAQGRWTVSLPEQKAGGPYTIVINGKEYSDVLFGDVFLCSGQSNMELPVARVTDMFAQEIAEYENTNIRSFEAPKVFDFNAPQTDYPAPVEWKPCTQENVYRFSALGYFFAKQLYANTQVPVAIVNASWGGTPIESWMSRDALKAYPLSLADCDLYADAAYRDAIKRVEGQNFAHWNRQLWASDPGMQASTKWYADKLDLTGWTELDDVFAPWQDKAPAAPETAANTARTNAGTYWLRNTFTVAGSWSELEATVRLGCIVDADSVWVNGVFIGTTGYQYPPRIYRVPKGVIRAGENTITVRVISNGGRPSFVPEKPYAVFFGPIHGNDIRATIFDGKWKFRRGAVMPSAPGMMFWCYKPTVLYNAMIAPLLGMQVAGTVWYQGESNVGRTAEYALMLKGLMANWRQDFQQPQMPFYVVELADFLHKDNVGGRAAWAEFRDMQQQVCQESENAECVPNRDLGEWNDIHPLDKKTLGARVTTLVMQQMAAKKAKK